MIDKFKNTRGSVKIATESEIRQKITEMVESVGSQVLAAKHIGVSNGYLGDILHGRRGISTDVAGRMGFRKVVIYIAE